ncbi:MAG: isoleucine--tRNA ligase [Nanoarchaeota archaeon]
MELERKYDFKKIETSVAKLWEADAERIFESLQFNPKNLYSWLEGPPTANAPPGIHHIEARVYKDLFLRFKKMQGFTVARKGGWDCHGLPVEVQVEKKLKLKSKKEVITFGVNKFIQECKKDVFSFIKEWNESTQRMAFWLDLENPYKTLDTPYMESVWWSLKEIHKKGLLYKGHKVVPYCPRCETPLSSHEVSLGYADVTEKSVTVTFKLKDEDAHLLVWTTTPWTLPSNNSIAVNKDMEYAYVEDNGKYKGKTYILAKELVAKYFEQPHIIKTLKGKELSGKKYVPLFDYYQNLKNAYFIITADYVNIEEGTGIVHQASAYGELDYEENKKHDVDFVHPVNRDGTFSEEVKDFKGMFVKEADPLIIEKLRKEGKLFIEYDYTHSYPFCWRCSTPLLYYAMDSWFIKVSQLREKLVKLNSQINWYPAHIKDGRFGNWLAEAKDWALSRNKFWGTPLPIWICESCSHQECIGSIKELEEKGKLDGKSIKTSGRHIDDLHITSVDPITIECPKCRKQMSRTPEVIDCWYDSGSAPFAQFHYPFENKEKFEKAFPYDFIVEAIDQTRGWFYTLHVISALLFDKPAYRNVAVAGLMCDEKGEKMSKSKGNIIKPEELFDKYGIDAVRLVMASYPLGDNIKFGKSQFDESIMPFFNTLWNTYLFVKPIIAPISNVSVKKKHTKGLKIKEEIESNLKAVQKELKTEDRWLISRVNSLAQQVTEQLEMQGYSAALTTLTGFLEEDLSRWYIKLIRGRVEEEGVLLNHILQYVMNTYLRLLAPFAPYLTEFLYHDLYKSSVHFESWPEKGKSDEQLEKDMRNGHEIVTAILGARDKVNIGVRWPLAEVVIDTKDKDIAAAAKTMAEVVKKQANIKKITVREFKVHYTLKPNYRNLGHTFGQETADVIELINQNKEKLAKEFEQGKEKVKLEKHEILPEHVDMLKEIPKEYVLSEMKNASLYLLTQMNESLEEEGFAREVIRRIQQLRKDENLNKTDVIELMIVTNYTGLAKHDAAIKKKVGAKHLEITAAHDKSKTYKAAQEFKVKEIEFWVGFNKVG